MGEIFRWQRPANGLPFTGERFTSEASGQIEIEHLHRYFLARELGRDKAVLDIASGEGYGAALLAQVARSVVGVEIDAEVVDYANQRYGAANLTFVKGDARAIPLDTASVDLVVSFETIEHVYEQAAFLAEVRRVLRPEGIFIVSTPDRDVYSPPDSAANPFHVRELTIPEFEALLRSRFEHVGCLLQRPMLGSALLPAGGAAGALPSLTFERRGDDHFEGSPGLPRALYAVALASTHAVALTSASLYIETSGVGLRLHETAEARAANEQLERIAAEIKGDNARLDTLFQEARSENARLEALFQAARSESERLEVLFQTARSENERLEVLFQTARSENERLEGLLADSRDEHARATSLLDELRNDSQRLNERLAAERAASRLALQVAEQAHEQERHEANEISARLQQIEASTSWRALAPARRIGRGFKALTRLRRPET